MMPGLDRRFGWLGALALAAGVAMATIGLLLGLNGWEITRTWFWLLGGAMGTLVGLQLLISWVLMRVLEELSVREARVAEEIEGRAEPAPAVPSTATAKGGTTT